MRTIGNEASICLWISDPKYDSMKILGEILVAATPVLRRHGISVKLGADRMVDVENGRICIMPKGCP